MPETNVTKINSASTATPQKSVVKRATAKNKPVGSPLASLKQEHKALRAVIRKAAQLDNAGRALVEEAAALWVPHTIIEETIIVPLLDGDDDKQERLNQAQVQRDLAKLLVADLLRSDEDEAYYAAKCAAAMDLMTEIMDAEEKPRQGLFALVAKVAKADASLGRRIEELRGQIQQDAEGKTVFPPAPLSLRYGAAVKTQSTKESDKMPRQSERDRDERGRFTSDDDDRGSRSSSRSSSRYDDRDRNYSSRSDDDRNGGSRSSSGRGRDTGGWFGDSEGHAEAARRGWRNSDHGDSGWYGDSEGHSEASRRGWEGRTSSRSSSRDDEDDRRSRGRDDDDRGSRSSRSSRDDDDRRSRSSQDDDGDRRSSRSSRDEDDDRRYSWSSREDDDRRYGRSSRDDEDDDRRGGSRSSGRDDDDRGNRSSRSSRDDDDDRRSSSRSRSRDDDDDDRRGSRSGSNPGWRGDSEGHAEAARRGWENRR